MKFFRHFGRAADQCLMPALSLAGRPGMQELVTCRPLYEPEAGRTIALAWRSTDPRAAAFVALAGVLRGALPEGVAGAAIRA